LGGKKIAKVIKYSGYEQRRADYESALVEVGAVLPVVIDKKKELLNTKMNRATKAIKIPWWNSIWPSREAYIVGGVRKLYEQTLRHLDDIKLYLESLTPVEAGKEAYKIAAEGGYYHPRLMEAMRKVNHAYNEMLKEMRKLGMV